jgi:hypothetical protein
VTDDDADDGDSDEGVSLNKLRTNLPAFTFTEESHTQPLIRIRISDRNNKPSLYQLQRCLRHNSTASKPNSQRGSHLTGSVNSGSSDISNQG